MTDLLKTGLQNNAELPQTLEKHYQIITHTAEQWEELHQELIADGNTYITVPSREVTVTDDKTHSKTRGVYVLTDLEAEELYKDARVKVIQLDPQTYPELYKHNADDIKMYVPPKKQRYTEFVGDINNYNYAFASSQVIIGNFNETDPGKASNQLWRISQKENKWLQEELSLTGIVSDRVEQRSAGEDVDLIIADNGGWAAHIEFMNTFDPDAVTPYNYKTSGNVLSPTGESQILDVILDGPYYIDPDWFDADPDNRLETRWDGTIVPTEIAARNWWRDTGERSPQFAEFGTVTLGIDYNRLDSYGTYSEVPRDNDGDHGTPCMGLAYGRTAGWAYNANKWVVNLYGNRGGNGYEGTYDAIKIFHLYKPNNPNRGNTKDPTIVSNSYGIRQRRILGTGTDWYAHWRDDPAITFGDGVAPPEYLRYTGVGYDSSYDLDDRFWHHPEFGPEAAVEAGKELVEAGVIMVCSAGNGNTQAVTQDHPNFNNFYTTNPDDTFDDINFEIQGQKPVTNRHGWPAQIGARDEFGNYDYKTITVGTIDSEWEGGTQERKVDYSNFGNAVDCFAPGQTTFAAGVPGNTDFVRALNDRFPTNVNDFPETYLQSRDTTFGGTSAACPIAAGLIASVVGNNRNWTASDVKSWLNNDVELQTNMYDPAEPTTPNGAWSELNALNGSDARIIYETEYTASTPDPNRELQPRKLISGALAMQGNIILRHR